MAGLETKVCGRCGGSGSYSYNSIHGTMCYGCNGKKMVLTKRGAAAAAYLATLRSVPASEVKVGDTVRVESLGYSYFAKVESVTPGESVSWDLKGVEHRRPEVVIVTASARFGKMTYHAMPESVIRKGWSAEEKAAQLALAVAYQATLTKAGKPRQAGRKAQNEEVAP